MADIQRLPAQPLHLLVGEGKNAKYVKGTKGSLSLLNCHTTLLRMSEIESLSRV